MRPLRSQILVVLVAVSILPIVLAIVSTADAQVARVEPLFIDLGEMRQNQVRETKVTVSNAGGGVLEISEVKADCGCTVAEIDKERLAPGERTTLTVNFDSKRFHGDVKKMVHLYTNDPDQPKVSVMISAKVHADLIVEPRSRRLKFPNTRLGDTRTMEATFEAPEVPELKLTATGTEKGLFGVKVVGAVDGNPQRAKVVLTLPREFPVGISQDNIRVSTNVEQEPFVDLTLTAYVGRLLVSYPESVNFRFKKSFHKEVRVHPFNRGELPFEVTKLETDVPGLEAAITGGKPNFEVVIELTGRPIDKADPRAIAADGKIKGTLFIHTNHFEVPVIEVPVSYLVRM